MQRTVRYFFAAIASLAVAGITPLAQAQEFPSKAVRLVVPFAPGAATDSLARMLAKHMAETFKQPVVVDNVPGAGGSIGAAQVARSAPDGHTILLSTGTLLSTWALNKSTPYDPIRDLRAVGEVARVPLILVTATNSPFSTFKEMRDYAASHPGTLSYGSPGVGTPVHIFSAYMFKKIGVEAMHVPYKGGSQQKTDLISGQVSMSFESPVATVQLLQARQLKALFVSKSIAAAPDVPSAAQVGMGDFEPSVWYGIVTPSGVSDARTARLSQALALAVASSDVKSWMESQGAIPSKPDAAAFQATLKADASYWQMMITEAGVKPE